MDDIVDLDSIIENDILDALKDTEPSSVKTSQASVKEVTTIAKADTVIQATNDSSNKSIELNSSSADDIASLINHLLNNKTLEITIKIKE